MRKVLLILALLGLMAAPAWAQCGPGGCAGGSCPTQPQQPQWQVPRLFAPQPATVQPTGFERSAVRVWNRVRLREQCGGSGVWVDFEGYQWVVSCFHLFSDGVGTVTVTNSDGTTAAARLVGYDRTYDVSVLIAEAPRPSVAVFLADNLPQPGAELLT